MKDADVRSAVHARLLKPFYKDGLSRILDEVVLGLDEARVDVVVINGALHGYELKSARDTLNRLPHQVEIYSKALDYVTLVVADNHLEQSKAIIPEWWGLTRAKKTRGRLYLKQMRPPRRNTDLDPLTIARFLWREEAEAFLLQRCAKCVARKPKYVLWQMIADAYPVSEISAYVRQTLKARRSWRVV